MSLKSELGFREDARGANLWLVVPGDAGVFHGANERNGVRCIDDEAAKAVEVIRRDFTDPEAVGPRRVAELVTGGPDDQVQANVVGFVSQLLRSLDKAPEGDDSP